MNGESECFIFDIVQSPDGQFVAVSLSDHTVKLYRWSSHSLLFSSQLIKHRARIHSITFGRATIYTGSSDGTVCCWDFQGNLLNELKVPGEVFSLATNDNVTTNDDALLAVGLDSLILLYSLKTCRQIARYNEAHSEDVTQLLFHPTLSNILISASDDNLVCVFDTKVSDPDEAMTHCFSAESSVRRIGLFGKYLNCIYVLTGTETLSLWRIGDDCDRIAQFDDLRELLRVRYFINCRYDATSQTLLLLSGGEGGLLQIARITEKNVEFVCALPSMHVAGVRSVLWKEDCIITGGEDARLCIWRSGPAPVSVRNTLKEGGSGKIIKKRAKRPNPY
eukprot:g4711.t1